MITMGYFNHTVDGPEKFESPVENGGKHPIILLGFQPSKMVVQDFATIHRSYRGYMLYPNLLSIYSQKNPIPIWFTPLV